MGLFNKKSDTNRQQKNLFQLTDITRGLHHAATTTSALLANHYMEMLHQYFDLTEDGAYKAKMMEMTLPDEKTILVPLISLITPKGLALERMKVAFSVKVGEAITKSATHEMDNSAATRSSFKVELSPKSKTSDKRDSSIMDIEMEFGTTDPPEGVMRMLDKFSSLVAPFVNFNETNRQLYDEVAFVKRVIQTTENTEEIKAILAQYGYDEKRFKEAYELCDEIRKIEEKVSEQARIIHDAISKANGVYQVTFQIARIALQKRKDTCELLGLAANPMKERTNWLNQATLFYNTILESEDLKFEMAKFNYDEDKLIDERKLIVAVQDNLDIVNDIEIVNKREELSEWISDFKNLTHICLKDRPQLLLKLFPGAEV